MNKMIFITLLFSIGLKADIGFQTFDGEYEEDRNTGESEKIRYGDPNRNMPGPDLEFYGPSSFDSDQEDEERDD